MAAKEDLSKLFEHLETRASEGLARLTFQGHAISKSGNNLHLATASGVVAIPASEIESVTPMFGQNCDWVSIVVRNAEKVTYICRVQPVFKWLEGIPVAGPVAGPVLDPGNSYTRRCDDTATFSGGKADATDDATCSDSIDDIPA